MGDLLASAPAQLPQEPGLSETPFSLHGAHGDFEELGSFSGTKSPKKA